MKNLFSKFFTIALISSVLIGCSSDDGPGIDQNLFGTWTLTTTVFRECTDSSVNEVRAESCNDRICKRFVFNSDNTFEKINIGGGQTTTINGTFEVRGDQIQLVSTGAGTEVVTFTVTATMLTLTSDIFVCQQDLIYSK